MNITLDLKLSNAFRYASIISTILVVSIHYNTKQFISLDNGITINYYIQEFITNGIARIAVPWFAFASGFFYFLKYRSLHDFNKQTKNRVHSILIPYIVVSTFIYITEYTYSSIKGFPFEVSPYLIIKDILIIPISVQFWFLRDLMILVLVAPLISFLMQKLKYSFTVLLLILWVLDVEFMPSIEGWDLLSIETLFFFVLGGYFSKHINNLYSIISGNSYFILLLLIYFILVTLRVYFYPMFLDGYINNYTIVSLIIQKAHILLGVYLLLQLSFKVDNIRILYLANFVFFVYLFHVYPLSRVINKMTDFFIEDQYKFYMNFILANLVCFVIAILLKKITPNIYKLISGSR